jgi:thiol-disulfide isomerase/thioredoxin
MRPLVAVVIVLALVIAAAAVGFFTGQPRHDADAFSSPPAGAPPAAAPVKPRAGKVLPLAEAMKELELIKPSRVKAAEALSVTMPGGGTFRLSEHRGKVVMINFWATWCPPCRAEIPDLVALQEKYRDHLVVIGISEDEGGPDLVRQFAAQHKINYPIVMMNEELEKMFPGVSALPTSFILDRESRIVQKHVGMLTARTTEYETRSLAGLPVNASIEEVDQTQGLKLDNNAQLMTIPGIDLTTMPAGKRAEALQKLNAASCTCGCDLTVAKCRVDDPACGVSLPLARKIVEQIASAP